MSYQMKYAVGNVQSAVFDTVWIPRKIRGASKYPVILLHGASGTSSFEADSPTFPSMAKLAAVLANNGIPVIAGYMGGNAWANDSISGTAGTAYINAALTYIAAQTGCSSAKAHVLGASMGAGTGIRWAAQNPSKAASVTGVIPMVNMNRLYTENPNNVLGGFPSGIATAWSLNQRSVADASITNASTDLTSATAAFTSADIGRQVTRAYTQPGIQVNTKIVSITSATVAVMNKPATATATAQGIMIADPLPLTGLAGADLMAVHGPALLTNSIPNRMFYASDDLYIAPSDVTAFCTASGGTAINNGTGGHANAGVVAGETYLGGTDWSNQVAWFMANGS